MVQDHVYQLCRTSETVSSALAQDPELPPGEAVQRLYKNDTGHTGGKLRPRSHCDATPEDLQRAYECGKWGNTRPSDLFLRIYHDVLCTLDEDAMAGMVSPPLMGSSGVVPLSIVSTVVDNVRHMANLIARAEKEVILATNFWAACDTSTLITNALRELSRRMGERGQRAVVKLMYDRGSMKQVLENHQIVPPSVYTSKSIKLPAPEEIPNVDMQVMNYHRPVLGTFHAKYMVVDRKVAVVCSCNIQETDNMEMSCHLEGPIVDSIYDMALIAWYKALEPPLPSYTTPAGIGGLNTEGTRPDGITNGNVPALAGTGATATTTPTGPGEDITRLTSREPLHNGATCTIHKSVSSNESRREPAPQAGNPIGIEGTARSFAPPVATNANVLPQDPSNAHEGGVSGDHLPSGEPIPEHTTSDPHYDPDIASEVARIQASVSPSSRESRMQAITRRLNTTIQPNTKGDLTECPEGEEMTPYIPHPVHEPFPIAMANRKPYGTVNQADVYVPQNEAWLSAIRNAEKTVFIQTPDLNADPVIPALLDAVRRGIEVTCFVCLGYNDAGELLPMQGGTNEMTLHKMYTALDPADRPRLRCAFYVGKDMAKPISNKFKKRSCHIKLMIIDSRIGIQGSGNQDTQSWFHSQEVNILFESRIVCSAWEDALRRNQNTHLYGWVSQEDGIWRDKDGKEAEGVIGIDPGRFSWLKGIVGAVQRVRGAGDF